MGKVIHASYSGYFPTCIISGTPTPSQEYLSLTLEQAMALFWRVRTWEAKASGSFRDNVLEANIEYTSGSFADMIPSIEIAEEKNLVCKGSETFYFQRDATATITPDVGDPYNTYGAIGFQYIFSSIKNSGSTYYPSFVLACVNSLTSVYTAKIGTYYIKYLGYTFTGDLFGQAGSSGSALIEVNAKEYWSYGGTYNTSTGQPL
jgi:hypothetical protein